MYVMMNKKSEFNILLENDVRYDEQKIRIFTLEKLNNSK